MQPETIISCVRIKPLSNKDEENSCVKFDEKSVLLLKTNEKYKTKNVVGFLEGSDSLLQKEVVVIGAHYDHVGFLKEHKADTDYIFNGADDNASGTSGVMAIAKAMISMKIKSGFFAISSKRSSAVSKA